jgi:hypothetical protein
MLQGQTHLVHLIFSNFFSFWAATVFTLSETSNDYALCCVLNYGNTLVQLGYCLFLSSCRLESTLPPAAQLLLLQSQLGDMVGHHLTFSNVLEKISRLSCEQFYATNTSYRKQEIFLYEYPLHCLLLSTKIHNITLLFCTTRTLFKHGRHFDCWSQPLSICMPVCYLDCHEAGLCCYLVIYIEDITSIRAVLLPFVTYLLTLPRTNSGKVNIINPTLHN